MKIIKTASGKQTIKISKREWQSIGKTAGWFPSKSKVPSKGEFGAGLNADAMKLLAQYGIDATELFRYDTPETGYPALNAGIQAAKNGDNEALRQALIDQFEK